MKLRYKLASIYLIVGLCLSMVALFGAVSVYNEYLFRIDAMKKCAYPSEIELELSGLSGADWEKFKRIWDDEQLSGVNVKLTDVYVKSNTSGTSWPLTVIVKSNIPERIWQTNGERFTMQCDEPAVAAGRYRSDYAIEDNGKRYVYLENRERFLLAEELGLEDSDFLDDLLIMRWQDVPHDWMDSIFLKEGIKVCLQSENYISDELVNEAAAFVSDCFEECRMSAARKNTEASDNVYLSKSKLSVPMWMYIFCAVILVQISFFWIKSRKKEILIRRMFGYSVVRIMLLLALDLLKLLFLAAILFFIIQAVFFERITLHTADIAIGIAYIAVTLGVCLILPAVMLKGWSCTELLNERQ